MRQDQHVATGADARELDRITAAHAAHGGGRYRLWLDERAGMLLVEPPGTGDGTGGTAEPQRIPLRSASCPRLLTELTSATLARLAAPADAYRTRPEADRDIGALVQLFRVQLARMRTEHPDPAGLVRAVHAQLGRAGDEQQAARRSAFLGWYLTETYGDDAPGRDRAERDLGLDTEDGMELDPDGDLVRGAVRGWARYREEVRGRVPGPLLTSVPWDWKSRATHWYYEFRALDRPLTERQRLELRAELPGAEVTSDSVVLDRWSGYDERPSSKVVEDVVRRYVDAGLHFDQCGTRTLWLRLPAASGALVAAYEGGFGVTGTVDGDDLVLRLHREESDGELSYVYHDPGPWLEELLPLRAELARGDVRALAIAWRAANETSRFRRAPQPPPMPDGLDEDELSPHLHALIRLLEEVP